MQMMKLQRKRFQILTTTNFSHITVPTKKMRHMSSVPLHSNLTDHFSWTFCSITSLFPKVMPLERTRLLCPTTSIVGPGNHIDVMAIFLNRIYDIIYNELWITCSLEKYVHPAILRG